ncbi:MAG: TAXI family TRAP transporter solute-binding subunit [Anaerolineales bacterium]|nr:TAXI family TRAP transporter solute-binding subunit [Anaerolineales bacterium]
MMKWVEKNLVWIGIALGAVLLIGAVAAVVLSMPPPRFKILTGREGGGYYQAALQYQKIAAERGFHLEIVPTAGSLDVLKRLEAGEASVGFVQGGTALNADPTILNTMAGVFYEPVWIFYRRDSFPEGPIHAIQDLKGKTIEIGEQGSGTNMLARMLLADNRIDGENATLVEAPTADALAALKSGQADAAFVVVAPNSQTIKELIIDPRIELMDLPLAPAYIAKHPFLTSVTLPAGAIDVVNLTPDEDKQLLATVANLVVRTDIHPDLLRLLTVAAVATHERGGIFEKRFEFPSVQLTDLPINKEATAYLERIKSGNSLLDNYLPFWAAAILDRYLLFVLPILLIVLPLLSRSPLVYQWYMRNKINLWYKRVHNTEMRVDTMTLGEVEQEIVQLDELDDVIARELTVSSAYMPAVYDLRTHITYVAGQLEKRKQRLAKEMPGPAQVVQ